MSLMVCRKIAVSSVNLYMQIPTKAGQICKILHPMEDENPEDVYIVAEDPAPFDAEDGIYIVNLRDLQRNLKNPAVTGQLQVAKSELNVIANNLEDYIHSWNN